MTSNTIAVVVNPRSANGRTGQHLDELRARLDSALPGGYELLLSDRAGGVRELTSQALRAGATRVAVVGGDGTINEALNGWFENDTPINPEAVLALVPRGTACDFSRTLGIPRDDAALELIASPHAVTCDVGRVALHDDAGAPRVHYFLNVAHFGIGGIIGRRISRGRKFLGGFVPYFYGVVKTLWRFNLPRMVLELNHKRLTGRILNVFIANGRFCGGGLQVSPTASLTSGQFEVTIIGDVGRLEVLKGIIQLYLMHYTNEDKVSRFDADVLKAEAPGRRVFVNLDGEPAGRLPAEFSVMPGAVRIAVAERILQAHESDDGSEIVCRTPLLARLRGTGHTCEVKPAGANRPPS